ncbi:MAG: 50S ribosomal protein L32 [Halobacteriovoraceae bacterium]|jgi:large subunit ribosomal protein L32|nr:50S ribosomal protein L32 [Halobacteriovoraceae bacterium]
MAVPKKKTSVSRKGLRRAGQHHKMYRKHPFSCPNCGSHILPHTVCSACGVYKGKEVIVIKDDVEAEAAAE